MNLLDDRITAHFRLSEFANTEDGNVMLLNARVILFIQCLEIFRVWYGRVMNITSGYRTAAFNKKVGGVSNSYHLKALAADFKLPKEYFKYSKQRQEEFINNIKNKWYEICEANGEKGSVIIYDTIIHLSFWPVWYYEDKRGK